MFMKRIAKLQKLLQDLNVDALLVDDPINTFYLTGLQLSAGKLLISKQASMLFVDGRYIEACKKNSPVPVMLSKPSNESILEWLNNPGIQSLGFNTDVTSYKAFLDLQALLNQATERFNKKIHLIPVENPVKQLRLIKDESELAIMREAGEWGSKGYDYVATLLKEGITEEEVANSLELYWKEKGIKATSFDPIIAFGVNSSMPHYRAGNTKLKKGDAVLIDIGVQYKHYASDMTRVIFFGNPHPDMIKIYQIVKDAQQAALMICRPGITVGAVDSAARDLIANKGYGDYFTHSLGHGVGLEIHESPALRNDAVNGKIVLEAGMVITIEPGIYLPGIGGVRLEDAIAITQTGYENLTNRSL